MAPYQKPPMNKHTYIVVVQGSGASMGPILTHSNIHYTNIAVVCHDAHCQMLGVSVPINT